MPSTVPLQVETQLPPLTTEMLVVFGVVLLALILFVSEALAIDVTAILIMVILMVLEPWTQISPEEGLAGFSSPATITVLAMLILSAGISRTGIVQIVGRKMGEFAGTNKNRQLLATIGVTGPVSGFINNTPVVAILVPIISDLAHNGKTSPSKLLIPLSYASQLGGMLTLIGTSTNILASSLSPRLLGNPITMFEFTKLGIIVLFVGSAYLLTIGYRLLPERIPPEDDLIEEYAIQEYLTEVVVEPDSPLIGGTVENAIDEAEFDADILQIVRDDETFLEPGRQKEIRAGDVLKLRTDRETLATLMELEGLSLHGTLDNQTDVEPETEDDQTLVEVVIPRDSFLVGESPPVVHDCNALRCWCPLPSVCVFSNCVGNCILE